MCRTSPLRPPRRHQLGRCPLRRFRTSTSVTGTSPAALNTLTRCRRARSPYHRCRPPSRSTSISTARGDPPALATMASLVPASDSVAAPTTTARGQPLRPTTSSSRRPQRARSASQSRRPRPRPHPPSSWFHQTTHSRRTPLSTPPAPTTTTASAVAVAPAAAAACTTARRTSRRTTSAS